MHTYVPSQLYKSMNTFISRTK